MAVLRRCGWRGLVPLAIDPLAAYEGPWIFVCVSRVAGLGVIVLELEQPRELVAGDN